MSHTLTIPDDLYAQLEESARRRGVTIEEMLRAWPIDEPSGGVEETELRRRRAVVARIDATRAALATRYGEMPDSAALIREDRAR